MICALNWGCSAWQWLYPVGQDNPGQRQTRWLMMKTSEAITALSSEACITPAYGPLQRSIGG